MDGAPTPTPVEDLDELVRIPGVFRRSEIEQVLRPGFDFHIQPERLLPGTELFAVYQQETHDAASWPVCGAPLAGHERTARNAATPASPRHRTFETSAAARARPEPTPSVTPCKGRAPNDEPTLGELKARRRDEHLCLACTHHLVCRMASALDETLLVTISRCRGFKPAEDGEDTTCELIPIEPSAAP